MDEAKADALYRLFKQTDAGARYKQGLGFASTETAPSTARWPTQPNASDKGADTVSRPSLASMFVKAGESKAGAAAEPQVPVKQQAQQSSREAAARVAARLAELKASKASQQQHSEAAGVGAYQHRSRSRSRDAGRDRGSQRGRDRSRDRSYDRSHFDRSTDEDRRHHHDRCVEGSTHARYGASRGREDGHDRHGSRDRRRDRDGDRGRHRSKDRSRDRSKGRDRDRSRDRSKERSRDRSRERGKEMDSKQHFDRQRDHRQEMGSGRDSRVLVSSSRPGPHSISKHSSSVTDWAAMIPGYERMSMGEQLRARTAYALKRADKDSARRAAEEVREEAQEAEEAGRQANPAAARPWTRYVFDTTAPLNEDGDQLATVTNQGQGDFSSSFGDPGTAARLLGVEGEGQQLNVVSFKASAKQLQTKERDDKHAAAIFGTAPSSTEAAPVLSSLQEANLEPQDAFAPGTKQGVAVGPEARDEPGHAADVTTGHGIQQHGRQLTDQDTLKAVLAGQREWSSVVDEDGPVLVIMDDTQPSQPTAVTQPGSHLPSAIERSGHAAVSQSVLEKQQGMSWRDRAQQAKQQKAAAAVTASVVEAGNAGQQAPMVLQLTWRDKARARRAAAG